MFEARKYTLATVIGRWRLARREVRHCRHRAVDH
jgi:hypothetical protein